MEKMKKIEEKINKYGDMISFLEDKELDKKDSETFDEIVMIYKQSIKDLKKLIMKQSNQSFQKTQ